MKIVLDTEFFVKCLKLFKCHNSKGHLNANRNEHLNSQQQRAFK
jgi:hypothetical protein